MEYHEIYIRDTSGTMFRASEYGIYAVDVPYIDRPTAKEPYKNEWHDEDGDDEYTEQLFFEAQEYEFTCGYKQFNMIDRTHDFEKELAQALGTLFYDIDAIYFECGHWGRKNVRLIGVATDAYVFEDGSGQSILTFKVKLKINDPMTRIKLQMVGNVPTFVEDGMVYDL